MKQFNDEVNQKDFDLGVSYTKAYISFCISNYVYQFNLKGGLNFIRDLVDFIKGTQWIPNTHNLTFKEFCKSYSLKE